ncbi:MAG: type 4a pilus biogenesis protein PilO [Patescibacteria group bacterium]|jgi:Tfp pilus assembly protein PilO
MLKFNFKKLDYTKKITIISGFLVLVLAAVIVWVDLPAVKNINKMKDEIEFQRLDLEKKYAKSQRIKKMALSLGKIENEVLRLDKVFISEYRELEFITRLEQIAQSDSVIQEINLNKSAVMETGGFRAVYLFARCQGSYENLVKYLEDIEALDYYINIEDLQITKGENEEFSLNLKALTYWR